MPCNLILTAGAKGGSGETTAAKFPISYLQENGCSPLIPDLDDESHTLSRFFPDAVQIGIQLRRPCDQAWAVLSASGLAV